MASLTQRHKRRWFRALGSPVTKDWRRVPGFACRQCGDGAREHPRFNRIWGCLRCRGSSPCLTFNFVENDERAVRIDNMIKTEVFLGLTTSMTFGP